MNLPRRQDLDALPDSELMQLARGDRLEAFECLVRRHQSPLVNFFRGMGVYHDAEDMAQDTFVRLFKYRNRYKPSAKFTTFLYLLARQVRIDALRAAKRKSEFEKALAKQQQIETQTGTQADGHAPDLEACLSRLTPVMREVVTLNIYQGLTYEEMAQTLGIPLGTVKSRLFHAMRILRAALESNADGEEKTDSV